MAEGMFKLRGITDERFRFFHCLHTLPEAAVVLIADLLDAVPHPANPYSELRCCILAAHQLMVSRWNSSSTCRR
jgi:hypothetical protein